MTRSRSLEKQARQIILEQMEELGEITTEAVMDLMRPHYIFDMRKLREQALRRTANSMMRSYKDDTGIRKCFNRKNKEGKSSYVNVDTTTNIDALVEIELQLDKKYKGLNESKKKINRRMQELSGQVTMDEIATNE